MSKPRRRRFFATRESKYQAQVHDDDGRGVYVPTVSAPSPEGTDPAVPGDPAALAARAAEDFTAGESSPYKTLPPAFQPSISGRRRLLTGRRFSAFRLGLVSLLCLGLGVLVGYWLPRHPAPGVRRPVPPDVKLLTAADQADLDAAYAARSVGDFKGADARFLALGKSHPAWQAMLVEMGRTRLYAHDLGGAAMILKQAAALGFHPAEADAILGALYKAERNYPAAEGYFDQAVALDPTNPIYYYFRGECLRDQGKLVQAVAQYHSALLRNQYEPDRGLYQVKLWLCEIESDQADATGIGALLDRALAWPDPPMEVLFASAARHLKAGQPDAAVQDVLRARLRADPGVYQIVLHDPVFAPLRARPELAPPAPAAAATGTPKDALPPGVHPPNS